jgi:hypothetical protein
MAVLMPKLVLFCIERITYVSITSVVAGGLTEDGGKGTIDAAEKLGRRGEIPREDVARTFADALENGNTYHKTFEILSGETPIPEALGRL